jgi:hypothetical protein
MQARSRVAVVTTALAVAVAPAVALAHGHGDQGRSGTAPGKSISQQHNQGQNNHGSGSSSFTSRAEFQCRTMLKTMGRASFDKSFTLTGTNKNHRNAFGKCVSFMAHQDNALEQAAHKSAEQSCQKEEASTGTTAFDQKYGSKNDGGKDAFGRCVSMQEKTTTDNDENAQVKAEDSAAKACRSEESSTGASAFNTKYGSKKDHGEDAFGKCVSQHAKMQEEQNSSSSSNSGSSS